jgi:hypothetical protein
MLTCYCAIMLATGCPGQGFHSTRGVTHTGGGLLLTKPGGLHEPPRCDCHGYLCVGVCDPVELASDCTGVSCGIGIGSADPSGPTDIRAPAAACRPGGGKVLPPDTILSLLLRPVL